MRLAEIPAAATVLIDANILLYCAQRASAEAASFLARCASDELQGVITSIVAAECCHRLMMMEAVDAGLAASNPARALARNRSLVRKLRSYADDVRDLLGDALRFEPIMREDFVLGLELQQRFSLLTNDSLNLAAARRLSIRYLATADANFDDVADLSVHKPGDLTGPRRR